MVVRIRVNRHWPGRAAKGGERSGEAVPEAGCRVVAVSLVPPARPVAAFVASMVLHCAGGAVLLSLEERLREVDAARRSAAGVLPKRSLQILLPNHVWQPLRAERPRLHLPAKARPRESRRAPARAGRPVPEKSKTTLTASAAIELPPLPRESPTEQTLLQLANAPKLKLEPELRLPPMLFWSAEVPKPVRPRRKPLVVPGRETPPAAIPELADAPALAPPAAEPSRDSITAAGLTPRAIPKLPLPASANIPVRVPKAANAGAPLPPPPGIDVLPGDATTVIALHENPILANIAVVPPGIRIGSVPPSAAPEAAGAAGSGGASPRGKGQNAAASQVASGESGSAAGGAANTAGPASGTAVSIRRGGTAELVAPVATRIVHPENGVFDIVVAQPRVKDGSSQAAAALKGDPIYTVYLRPGTAREWTLHYCAADLAGDVRRTATGVALGDPRPIRAPYPRVTVTPPPAALKTSAAVLIHGFMTAQGDFRNLQPVRRDDIAFVSQVEPFLKQWQFRPATRNGLPIEVEVLLVIPSSDI